MFDSAYTKVYTFPAQLQTDSEEEAKVKFGKVLEDAEDCFIMHKALVDQCTK